MKCAIHQPQFLPWLGYLSKIHMADIFVILDNVQFKKNEFQNRNRIPTRDGTQWLTVPVSFRFGDTIRNVSIADHGRWRQKMKRTLTQHYGTTVHFSDYYPALEEILNQEWSHLAELNAETVHWLMSCFDITTPTVWASDLSITSTDRSERLVEICKSVGSDTYLSGSVARCYLDLGLFHKADMEVEFQDFCHPEYPQMTTDGDFVSHMSAVDALFCVGGGCHRRSKLNI